jgi:hypothetical protein
MELCLSGCPKNTKWRKEKFPSPTTLGSLRNTNENTI